MNVRRDRLVWLDLETSTSDETESIAAILEVGLTVTDLSGRLISEKSFVNELTRWQKEHMFQWDEVVLKMHTANGLLWEVLKKEYDGDSSMVEEIHDWMDSREFADDPQDHTKPEDEIYMVAGSGLHFDRRYLRKHLPSLDKRFTYYNIDVGGMRRMMLMHMNHLPPVPEKSLHRALDCNRDSIAWYQLIIDVLKDADEARQRGVGAVS